MVSDLKSTIIGTSSNSFAIGDGTDGYKYIYAATSDTFMPGFRYNPIIDQWEFSNDGYAYDLIGNVFGPTGSLNESIALFDGANGKLIKDSLVTIDGYGNIVTPGTINGRDITTDGYDLDNHINDFSNPHVVTPAQVGNTTAQWNANQIQGVTVDGSNIEDGYVLKYNSISGNLEYVTDTAGSGDVVGPSSSLDNEVAIFDGTTGKLIQGSGIHTDGYGNVTSIGYVDYETFDPSTITHKEGRVFYDENDKTLSLMTDIVGTTLQMGQESLIRIYNNSGATIPDGYVVYINGSFGDRPTVALASSTDQDTSVVIGVATQAIPNNQEGMITNFGLVRGINTSAWIPGTVLYLSTIPGMFADSIPTSGDVVILIATVTKQDATEGAILVNIHIPTRTGAEFPVGFENQTDSKLSFDEGTRTFSIQPKSPATFFRYWSGNSLYKKVGIDSVTIPDVTGPHYFYYDGYDLVTTTIAPLYSEAWVASVLWDGVQNVGLSDERHTIKMGWATHEYLHESIGTKYISGLTGLQLTSGGGAADTDAQFTLTDGLIFDEDIEISIIRNATSTEKFEQEIGLYPTTPGEFPVYYQDGYGVWTKDVATTFPMRPYDGYIGSRLGYSTHDINNYWTVEDVGENNYVAYWIIGTNNIEEPVMSLMGVSSDARFEDADNNNSLQAMLYYILTSASVLPFREMKIFYRLIVKTSLTYTNTIKATIVDVKDYRNTSINVLDHSGLGGRDNVNQHPASAISVDTSGFSSILSAADDTAQKAFDTIDDHVQGVIKGGTGFSTYTTGDILYSDTTNSLAKLPIGADGYHLVSNGSIPQWEIFPTFGADYSYEESTSRSTTTSTTFQTKVTLTTPPLNGTYLVSWSATVDHSNRTTKMQARLRNTTDSTNVTPLVVHEPKDVANRTPVGGVAEVVFSGPAKTFEIQYRAQTTNTAGIAGARIVIWKT